MTAEGKSFRPEWAFVGVLVLVNLAAKGSFIGINTGEYTDGILQLTVFENRAGLYPPLYGALAHVLAMAGVSLEMAGRIISVVAAALCVVPVYWLGLRLGGAGAARLAGLLYTVAPMPWRWSVRVMTDSLFLLLSTITLVLLMEAWSRTRRPADDQITHGKSAHWCLAAAVAVAGLSVLTRYQGVLFVPLIVAVFIMYFRQFRSIPWLAVASGLVWLTLPVWMQYNGFVHQGQFASRTAPTPLATVSAWINTFESFLLISPYYMGYPIVIAAVAGLFYLRRSASRTYLVPAAWLWGGYSLMLLGLHAAFGTFQHRYMMPILPVLAALAGVGFTWLDDSNRGRRWVFSTLLLVSVVYLSMFSLAVLVLQREAFGDQREAAEFIREQIPADVPVLSNERYGSYTDLGAVKLSYWSGRRVDTLIDPATQMKPGAIVALGTAYGGNEAVTGLMQALSADYDLQPFTPRPFQSVITPLMDDIMVNPMFNQNPMGWVMRYVPQPFATQLFVVQPRSGNAGAQ
jgi:hypothetical protein